MMSKGFDIKAVVNKGLSLAALCLAVCILGTPNFVQAQQMSTDTTYKNARDYYKNVAKQDENTKMSGNVKSILETAKDNRGVEGTLRAVGKTIFDSTNAMKVDTDKNEYSALHYMEQLEKVAAGGKVWSNEKKLNTNLKNVLSKSYKQYTDAPLGTDSSIEDILGNLNYAVTRDMERGILKPEEAELIFQEAARLAEVGKNHAVNAIKADVKDQEKADKLVDKAEENTAAAVASASDITSVTCPSSDLLRAKYMSGCWSCLILEKISSAFLNTAKKAYGVSQKAGLTVMWIGAIFWVLLWGLKNVSSMAQVEPANILNDIVKFLFKLALAYWFIVNGLPMLKNYFITPIMGTGAVIADQFWGDEFRGNVVAFDWDTMTDEDLQQQAEETQRLMEQTPLPTKEQKETIISEPLSQEQKATLAENDKNFAETKSQIPNFLIPGIQTGCLTSPFGCRIPPTTGSSSKHHGVDIGLNCIGKKDWSQQAGNCIPVIAAGPGVISYAGPGDNSAGFRATIDHGKVGKYRWMTKYFHMKAASGKFKNGDKVSQGQPIGCVGNTGVGTAPHLHFEVLANGNYVDPMSLPMGKIQFYNWNTCTGENASYPQPSKYNKNAKISGGWSANGTAVVSLGVGSEAGYTSDGSVDYASMNISIGEVKYSGPVEIMPKSVMDSILGATKVITDLTAQHMVLGEAVMCYSKLERGGRWKVEISKAVDPLSITNIAMWLEGAIIFMFGLLITMAIVFYLLDMSFKVGFAVIAMPIAVGLWPFGMTKDKLSVCVSILAKAAATFAFLAMTTTFVYQLTDAVISMGDTAEEVASGEGGIYKIFKYYDEAGAVENVGKEEIKENIEYMSQKLALFSTTFVMLLFVFLYSYKLVKQTIPDLSDKFFKDHAFGGNANPMHSKLTGTVKRVKDVAMKPAGLARDIAINQGTRGLKNLAGKAIGGAKNALGIGSGRSGNSRGGRNSGSSNSGGSR